MKTQSDSIQCLFLPSRNITERTETAIYRADSKQLSRLTEFVHSNLKYVLPLRYQALYETSSINCHVMQNVGNICFLCEAAVWPPVTVLS
jgi:hypothetical protein